MDHDNTEDTPDQQDCWDDANISRLIDLEAFRCSLHGYNQLLENSDSDDNGRRTPILNRHRQSAETQAVPTDERVRPFS